MINLYYLDAKSFKIEESVIVRQFEAYVSRFNDLILKNIFTGYRINLGDIESVKIDGSNATLESIKQLVYNYNCNCTSTSTPTYKIFDFTYDKTFQ